MTRSAHRNFAASPEACDLDHLFTEAQREALGRQAEELVEVELEEAGRASDED